MLTSLSVIFLSGLFAGSLLKKIRLPSLLGMLIVGILLGPDVFNILDEKILTISTELRQIALIIILFRAGLSLDIADLKSVGRPAILLCCIPACFEICGVLLLAPVVLHISLLDAAIVGSVLAAVSPAVIVPRMLFLMKERLGVKKHIPQLLMAGSSVDDVFVIVLFTSFVSMATGTTISADVFLQIPFAVFGGCIIGLFIGKILIWLFTHIHLRDTVKVLIMLSVAFLCVSFEEVIKQVFPYSGLLSVISMGIVLNKFYPALSKRIMGKFEKLWIGAELLLFVLVGAEVSVSYAVTAGLSVIMLILGALLFRMIGVYFCLIKTELSIKEKIFCMVSYIPKATVQAAIGVIPLSLGLGCGELVLTVAVLAILITAPLGAFLIDLFSPICLEKDTISQSEKYIPKL